MDTHINRLLGLRPTVKDEERTKVLASVFSYLGTNTIVILVLPMLPDRFALKCIPGCPGTGSFIPMAMKTVPFQLVEGDGGSSGS